MRTASELALEQNFRAVVYRALADAFHLPGPETGAALQKLEDALAVLDSEARETADQMCRAHDDTPEVLDLQIDFARLFAGPFLLLAPPYGSVYLEGERRIMGESTIEAERWFKEAGLELAEDFKEAPDHIAAELEFMHVLVCREIDAICREDIDAAQRSVALQKSFLKRHLGAWTPAFTARILENARTDFYRRLAEVTRTFLSEEVAALAGGGTGAQAAGTAC